MAGIFKNIAVIAGVLLLSAIIYFVVSDNQQFRDNVFDRSLQLLGQQFLALLPAGAEREIIANKWQTIVERAHRGEIQPEQVERIAVGILNASNLDTQISVADAEIILNLAYHDANLLPAIAGHEGVAATPPAKVRAHKISQKVLQQRLQEVGKKLEMVCVFNSKIKSSCDADPAKQRTFVRNLRYEISDGIRLNADPDLKHELNSQNFWLWKQELNKLEEKRLLAWQQNFADELAIAQEKLNAQLDSLHAVIAMQQNHALQAEINAAIAKVKKLEKLQQWHVVEPVTVQKVLVGSLNALDKKAAEPPKPPAQQN